MSAQNTNQTTVNNEGVSRVTAVHQHQSQLRVIGNRLHEKRLARAKALRLNKVIAKYKWQRGDLVHHQMIEDQPIKLTMSNIDIPFRRLITGRGVVQWERCDLYKDKLGVKLGCKVHFNVHTNGPMPSMNAQIVPCEYHKLTQKLGNAKIPLPSTQIERKEYKEICTEVIQLQKELRDGFSTELAEITSEDAKLGLQLILTAGNCAIINRPNLEVGQAIPDDRRLISNIAQLFSRAYKPWKVFTRDSDFSGLIGMPIGSPELVYLSTMIDGNIYVNGQEVNWTDYTKDATYVIPGIENWYDNHNFVINKSLVLTTKKAIDRYMTDMKETFARAIPFKCLNNTDVYFEAQITKTAEWIKNQRAIKLVTKWPEFLSRKGLRRWAMPGEWLYDLTMTYLEQVVKSINNITFIEFVTASFKKQYEDTVNADETNFNSMESHGEIHDEDFHMNEMNFDWENDSNQMEIDLERQRLKAWTEPIGNKTYNSDINKLCLDDLTLTEIKKQNPEINGPINIVKHEDHKDIKKCNKIPINAIMGFIPAVVKGKDKTSLYNCYPSEYSGGWCGFRPIIDYLILNCTIKDVETLSLEKGLQYVLKACLILGIPAPSWESKVDILKTALPMEQWPTLPSLQLLCDFFCIPAEFYRINLRKTTNNSYEPVLLLSSRNFRTKTDKDPLKLNISYSYKSSSTDQVIAFVCTQNHVLSFYPRHGSTFIIGQNEATIKMSHHILIQGRLSNNNKTMKFDYGLEMGIFKLLRSICSTKTSTVLKQRQRVLKFTGVCQKDGTVMSVLSTDGLPLDIIDYFCDPTDKQKYNPRMARPVIVCTPFIDSKALTERIKMIDECIKATPPTASDVTSDYIPKEGAPLEDGETYDDCPIYTAHHFFNWNKDDLTQLSQEEMSTLPVYTLDKDDKVHKQTNVVVNEQKPAEVPKVAIDILKTETDLNKLVSQINALAHDLSVFKNEAEKKFEANIGVSKIRQEEMMTMHKDAIKSNAIVAESLSVILKNESYSRALQLEREAAIDLKMEKLEKEIKEDLAKKEAKTTEIVKYVNELSSDVTDLFAMTKEQRRTIGNIDGAVNQIADEVFKVARSEYASQQSTLSEAAMKHNKNIEKSKDIIKQAADKPDGRSTINEELKKNDHNPELLPSATQSINTNDMTITPLSLKQVIQKFLSWIFNKFFKGPAVGDRSTLIDLIKTVLKWIKQESKGIVIYLLKIGKYQQMKTVILKLRSTIMKLISPLWKLFIKIQTATRNKIPTIPYSIKLKSIGTVSSVTTTTLTKSKYPLQFIKHTYSKLPIHYLTDKLKRAWALIKLFKTLGVYIPTISRTSGAIGNVNHFISAFTMMDWILSIAGNSAPLHAPMVDMEGINETSTFKPCTLLKDNLASERPTPYIIKCKDGQYRPSILYRIQPNPLPVQQFNYATKALLRLGFPANTHMAGNPTFPTLSLVDKYELIKPKNMTYKRLCQGYYYYVKYMLARSRAFRYLGLPLLVATKQFKLTYNWYTIVRDAEANRNNAIRAFYDVSVSSQYIDESVFNLMRQPVFLDTNLPLNTIKGMSSAQLQSAVRGVYWNDAVEQVFAAVQQASANTAHPVPSRAVVHTNTFELFFNCTLSTIHREVSLTTQNRVVTP